MHVSNSQL